MRKYNYDKSPFRRLRVVPFLSQVKERNEKIELEEKIDIPDSVYNANRLAAALHPPVQHVRIKEVLQPATDARTYVLVPDKEAGTEHLAYFRAGQYINVTVEIQGNRIHIPYSLNSSPKQVLDKDEYEITIRVNPRGRLSNHIFQTWKPGTRLDISAPLGEFTYNRLRDAKAVAALVGGSSVTPYISVVRALLDGTEDFDLTLFYGNNTAETALFKEELDRAAATGKVRVVHVISDEVVEGCEHGFISAEILSKYMEGEYSVFVCGPKPMTDYTRKELDKLQIPRRRIRYEVPGEAFAPEQYPGYVKPEQSLFEIRVKLQGSPDRVVLARADRTVMQALEQAGIEVPAHCRSGECGWCHSRLAEGEVFTPEDHDWLRAADRKFGWIHPCAAFPLSDLVLEVPVFGEDDA